MRDGTAIFIDLDNIGRRATESAVAEAFSRHPADHIAGGNHAPNASDRRAYMGEGLRHMAAAATRAGLECVIGSTTAKGFNNGTDHRLVVDAMSLATSPNPPRHIVIVSGDADFVPLIHALNRLGIDTTVAAGDNANAALRNAAGHFVNIAASSNAADPTENGSLAEVVDISTRRTIPRAGRPA